MKQLRRDNTGAGPRRCRSPPIVRTVVEGERRSPGSSSWRSSIRELPSLSQAGTGSRTMAPRGWRQRRKALWSGEAIVTNFEGAEKSDRPEKSSICEIVAYFLQLRAQHLSLEGSGVAEAERDDGVFVGAVDVARDFDHFAVHTRSSVTVSFNLRRARRTSTALSVACSSLRQKPGEQLLCCSHTLHS